MSTGHTGDAGRTRSAAPSGRTTPARTEFAAAAAWTASLVRAIPNTAWAGPGLGDWDLRALTGHTSRAMLTVEQYLRRPVDRATLDSPLDYFAAVQASAVVGADRDAVLQRGIAAGEALGDDPAAAFCDISARVTALVAATADDPVLPTIAGGMHLQDYLPTRTFELVVHGLDIARAIGLEGSSAVPPEASLRTALSLATDRVVGSGSGPDLLLSLTGRGSFAAATM